jgi:hypothetical protein
MYLHTCKVRKDYCIGGEKVGIAGSEPVVIDVLWGKVATKVGTFLVKSMNLVPTCPHGPQSYRQCTYLVSTFKKRSNLVPTLKFGTLVPTMGVQ